MKERINGQHDRVIAGSLKKELIEVLIHTEKCSCCKGVQRHVENLRIWSRATKGEHLDPWRMTQEIHGKGMLDFNIGLPIRKVERTRMIPACAECVDKLTEKNKWNGG